MASYAQVKNKLIVNIVAVEEKNLDLIKANVDEIVSVEGVQPPPCIGWSYEGGSFSPPVKPDEGSNG